MSTVIKITIVLFIAWTITGCEVQHQNRAGYAYAGNDKSKMAAYAALYEAPTTPTIAQERMVIYNANLELTVKNPDTTNTRLTEIAAKHEGYVLTLGNRQSVIRVKSVHLNEAVLSIASLGKLKQKVISGDDVTDQYTDIEIRLENAKKARQRYLELLAKAENVEAALKVEKELERLNGEIDGWEGRMKMLKHLSEYSTITVQMNEKVKLGLLGYIGVGLYKGVRWLFVRN